jgi:hypothetical protein
MDPGSQLIASLERYANQIGLLGEPSAGADSSAPWKGQLWTNYDEPLALLSPLWLSFRLAGRAFSKGARVVHDLRLTRPCAPLDAEGKIQETKQKKAGLEAQVEMAQAQVATVANDAQVRGPAGACSKQHQIEGAQLQKGRAWATWRACC